MSKQGKRTKIIIIGIALLVLVIGGVAAFLFSRKGQDKLAPNNTQTQVQDSPTAAQLPDNFSTETSATDEAGVLAAANVSMLAGYLEEYYSQNDFYPGELKASNHPTANAKFFTPPDGVKYVYSPEPKGCSTANKDCKSFVLTSQRTDGTIISTKKSF